MWVLECPFVRNVQKISGPKRSIKITDHFTCTSANVIDCITCTLSKKLIYASKTGRQPGNRFREHLLDVGKDNKNASQVVMRGAWTRAGWCVWDLGNGAIMLRKVNWDKTLKNSLKFSHFPKSIWKQIRSSCRKTFRPHFVFVWFQESSEI